MKNHHEIKSLTTAEQTALKSFATACGLTTQGALLFKADIELVGLTLPKLRGQSQPTPPTPDRLTEGSNRSSAGKAEEGRC